MAVSITIPLLFFALSCHLDFLQDPLGFKTDFFALKMFMYIQALL